MNFIYVHGRPASGKDTQAKKIQEGLPNSVMIVPGEIFRNASDPKNPYYIYYDEVSPYLNNVDKGEIVPEEVTMDIVKDLVGRYSEQGIENFVFTGFPRTKRQLDLVDDYVSMLKGTLEKRVGETHVVYILSEAEVKERSKHRKESDNTRRADDNTIAVENRLKVFRESTVPMLAKLAKERRLISIRGEGSIEEVREKTETKLQTLTGSPERR